MVKPTVLFFALCATIHSACADEIRIKTKPHVDQREAANAVRQYSLCMRGAKKAKALKPKQRCAHEFELVASMLDDSSLHKLQKRSDRRAKKALKSKQRHKVNGTHAVVAMQPGDLQRMPAAEVIVGEEPGRVLSTIKDLGGEE